jgi:Rrf2 family transcriptional regulator, iron-sulfur cluster assembly transcription factor
MYIPPKCRLAVAAMMDLALRQHLGPVPLSAISTRQNVSPSYLDLLFGRLRRKGLVTGTRGPGGGYTLARDTSAISLADIVSAVDEGDAPANGSGHRSFASRPTGSQRIGSDWSEQLEKHMLQMLAEVALEEVIAPHRASMPERSTSAARLPTAKGVGARQRMVVIAANSVFGRPLRLAI